MEAHKHQIKNYRLDSDLKYLSMLANWEPMGKNEDKIYESEGSPLTVLKRRLEKGEITKEEFDRMKEDLKEQILNSKSLS